MIYFRDIDRSNYYDIIAMKLPESQTEYISDNIQSLADCWLFRHDSDLHPQAIYADDLLIGFVMLRYQASSDRFYLWRLLIDEVHQAKGYGHQVMSALIEMAKSMPQVKRIVSDYVQGNDVMKHLFQKFGFQEVEFVEKYQEMSVELRFDH